MDIGIDIYECCAMNCFEHEDVVAVGHCKYCLKGICKSCARIEESGLHCSESCAARGAELHELNKRALKIYNIGQTSASLGPGVVIYGVMGLVFLTLAFFSWFNGDGTDRADWAGIAMGSVMIGVAAYLWVRQKKLGVGF